MGSVVVESTVISNSVVNRMLTNRYYLGVVICRGVEYEGRHDALTDPITFARVQAQIALNRQGEKQRTHRHYLKSTLVCGRCGARMCFARSRGRRGDEYDYFFCVDRQTKRSNCDLPWIPVHDIEAAIERT